MTTTENHVLAGFVVARPWKPPPDERLLPASAMTMSECLAEFLPLDQDPHIAPWHLDLPSAAAAVGRQDSEEVHILGVHVPSADRVGVLTMFDRWTPDTAHPVLINLNAMAVPVGEPRGFEVVGFESGHLHSWLCYGLHAQAVAELDIAPGRLGLLADLDEARAVATVANDNRDTPNGTPLDVTWFPVLVAEC